MAVLGVDVGPRADLNVTEHKTQHNQPESDAENSKLLRNQPRGYVRTPEALDERVWTRSAPEENGEDLS